MLISHNTTTILQPYHIIHINNNNHNENDPSLIIPLSRILNTDEIPAIKYLGVYFDPDLNFKYHINQINKKLSYAIYSLRQVSNLLPPKALKTLYYTLFHCHITYAIEIWSNVPPALLAPLIKKQKTAIRIISNMPYNSHTEPLFKSLSILPLPDLIQFFNLKLFHSFKFNTAPFAFKNIWKTTLEQRHLDGNNENIFNLRNNDDYFIPPSRTQFLSRFPLYNLPSLWNNLPPLLREQPDRKLFSPSIKKYLLSKLSFVIQCNRLMCPSCLRHVNN
jgi:hypothetical protein